MRRLVEADGSSVARVAGLADVAHMTLRRFVYDGTKPNDDALVAMFAFLTTQHPPTAEEAAGMLRAVYAIRRELARLEAAALAVAVTAPDGDARTGIGEAVARITPPAPDAHQASAPKGRRRAGA